MTWLVAWLLLGWGWHGQAFPMCNPDYCERIGFVEERGLDFVRIVALDPETDQPRRYDFHSEHVYNHFRLGACAVIITNGREVTLRHCEEEAAK